MIEGLGDIEEFEDLDDSGKGFHFFGQPNKKPSAAPMIANKHFPPSLGQKHSPPALALGNDKITPLTNMPVSGHGRKSSSYGKKIGFDDDFDDDWDDTDRKNEQPKQEDG